MRAVARTRMSSGQQPPRFFDAYAGMADGALSGRPFGLNTGLVYGGPVDSGASPARVQGGLVNGAAREWSAGVAGYGNDFDISLTFTPGSAENGQPTDYTDLRARVGGATNGDFIMVQVTQSACTFYRFVNGAVQTTFGFLGSGASAGVPHVLRMRAAGTSVQAWLDGTSVGSGTDSSTGTKIGFHNYALSGAVARFGAT